MYVKTPKLSNLNSTQTRLTWTTIIYQSLTLFYLVSYGLFFPQFILQMPLIKAYFPSCFHKQCRSASSAIRSLRIRKKLENFRQSRANYIGTVIGFTNGEFVSTNMELKWYSLSGGKMWGSMLSSSFTVFVISFSTISFMGSSSSPYFSNSSLKLLPNRWAWKR